MSSDDLSKYRYTRTVLLEMAVAVEESAKEFYMTLSHKFSEHKALFNYLAEDEENHAKTYAKLLGKVEVTYPTGGRKVEEVYPTEEERRQADHNIQMLESLGLISNLREGASRAKEVADLGAALEASVQLEKDTLLFYQNLTMALGRTDRQQVYKIMNVELNHLYRVQNITL